MKDGTFNIKIYSPKLKNEIEEFTKNIKAQGEKFFTEAAKLVFEKFGHKVQNFGWQQYTPYWCDGEPCEFSVYADNCLINGETADDKEYELKEQGLEMDVDLRQAYTEIPQLIECFDEEFMRLIFGDHVAITCYPDRVEIEEQDHE